MEFHEKLQQLRKDRGLTQEELAQALFVSRTAVSKWESGRGYPSIDSLKEISGFFSVSIDDLLSGDKLISIAEKENKADIRGLCDALIGAADLFSAVLAVFPLYPGGSGGQIHPVSLTAYAGTSALNRGVYWALILALIACGLFKLLLTKSGNERWNRRITGVSMALGVLTALAMAAGREAYAASAALMLLVVKGMLLIRQTKAGLH